MDGVPSWVRKGARVVCVNAEWLPGIGGADDELVVGKTYEVESVTDIEFFYLVGVVAEKLISRFRPLVEDSEEDGIEARLFHAKGLKHHNKKPSTVEGERA